MKKLFIACFSVMCLIVACLSGCSAGGDCVNCFTNMFGCTLDGIASCNGCVGSRCATYCTTCGLCGGTNDSCYDCLTGYNCHVCGEKCKSYTCTDNTYALSESDTEYSIETNQADVQKVETLVELQYDKQIEYYVKVIGSVSVTFHGDNVKFDNVRLVCTLSGGGSSVESTRWLGSVKSDKMYTVEPEFYLSFTNTHDSDYFTDTSYYTLTFKAYGEKK